MKDDHGIGGLHWLCTMGIEGADLATFRKENKEAGHA